MEDISCGHLRPVLDWIPEVGRQPDRGRVPLFPAVSMIFGDVTGIKWPTSGSVCHDAPHARGLTFRRQACRASGWERSRTVKIAAADLANASVGQGAMGRGYGNSV